MNLHQQLFVRSRAHALQRGLVLDISPAARQALIEAPMAITPRLWRSIAPDDPFRLEDPRLLCLCWSTLLTVITHTSTRAELKPSATRSGSNRWILAGESASSS
jgi:hypothetical protein